MELEATENTGNLVTFPVSSSVPGNTQVCCFRAAFGMVSVSDVVSGLHGPRPYQAPQRSAWVDHSSKDTLVSNHRGGERFPPKMKLQGSLLAGKYGFGLNA